jgi:RNA polymerase sigma factor (sigma-70 family)
VTPAFSATTQRLAAAVRGRRRSVTRSAAARGDGEVFAELYERHHQALYRYCRSILHHEQDAQDALQSTMTRAFAALQDERRDFPLRPWLFRIAQNEAISLLRRRRPEGELDELAARDAPVEEQVSLRADLEILQRDLAALPERQRAALVLRELNGLSHREIGQVLGCTASSVKQSIFEARTELLHAREGREMSCDRIRRALSDGDGRVLRGGRMRAHLRACPACRRFQHELVRRPRELAMLAPPLPVATGAALIQQLLPVSSAATASTLSTLSAGTLGALAPKAAVTIAVAIAAAGGTAAVRDIRPAPAPHRPAVVRPATVTSPPRTPPGAQAAGRAPTRVGQGRNRPAVAPRRAAAPQRSNRRKHAHVPRHRAPGLRNANPHAREPARGHLAAPVGPLRRPPTRGPVARKAPGLDASSRIPAAPSRRPAAANGRSGRRGHG